MYRREPIPPATQRALEQIGAEILRARLANGWSQRELERLSGVDQTTISRFERGLAPGLRTETVARLRAALDGPFSR